MKRWKKILIGVLVFIAVIIVAGVYYADNIIEKFVNRELSHLVDTHKEHYQIKVGKVKSSFLLKRISFSDVDVKALNPNESDSILDFEFSLNKLILRLYDYKDVLSDGELNVKRIELDEPHILLNLALDSLDHKGKKGKKRKKFGSKLFSKVLVDIISINKGALIVNRRDSVGLESIAKIEIFDLNVESALIDLDSTATKSKFEYKEFDFDLSGIDFNNISDHFLKVDNIIYKSSDEYFMVENIQFENSKSLDEFKQTVEYNTPWVNLNVSELKFKIPIEQVVDKNLHLNLFQIGPVELDLYQDNTLPAFEQKKMKFSYTDLLKKINFPLTIDTIRLLPSKVDLSIKDKLIKKIDRFNIKDLKAEILFVSSDSVYQKAHPELSIVLNSLIWEDVPLDIQVKLDVDSASDRLEGHIAMNDLSYSKIKSVIEERIGLNLQSGYVDHFHFNFLLFRNNLKGDLDLAIRDIQINPNRLIFADKIEDFKFSLKQAIIKAEFDRDLGMKGKLTVDTLLLIDPDISWVNVDEAKKINPKKVKVKTADALFKTYIINYYDSEGLSLKIYNKSRDSLAIVSIDDGWIKSKAISVKTNQDGTANYNPGQLSLRLNKVGFNNSTSNFFDINQIDYVKQRGQLILRGFRYKSNGSKFDFLSRRTKDKFWMGLYVEKGTVDFDILKIIKGDYRISKVDIKNPILTFVNDPNDQVTVKSKKKKNMNAKDPISFIVDKIVLDGADVKYSIRTKQNKEHKVLLANKINCRVSNITNDSLQLSKNHDLKLDLIGHVYDQSRINIAANLDQRKGMDKANLDVDLVDLSLKELNKRLKPFISKKFKKGKLSELHLVLKRNNKKITGNVSLKELEIEDLELNEKAENPNLLTIKVPDVKIDLKRDGNDISPVLKLGSVELIKPEIALRNHSGDNKKSKKPFGNKSVFASQAEDPNLIIENFNIKYALFTLFTDEDPKPHSAIHNANLSASGIRLYKNNMESLLPLSVNNLVLEAKEISTINNPDIFMNVSSIKYDLKDEKLTINNLTVKNTKTLVELYKGQLYRKPWFDAYAPKVRLYFDLDQLVSSRPHIRRVDIDGTKFLFEFDFKLAINPQIKPLFVDMIKAPSIPYTIDTVSITNSDATIYMQENSRDRSGYLIFNDINGTIDNISNDPEVIAKKPNTLIDVRTVLWGEGKGHVIGEISLTDPDKYFNLKGVVDTMDLTVADTLIKNVFNMSIKSGRLNQAKFDIDFNEKQANGSVLFNYENLKVTMYKGQHAVKVNTDTMSMAKVDKKEKLNSGFMMKIIVNGLIKENNLPGKGNYAIGSAAYIREPDKPVFRYVWYSMAAGLLETAEGGFIRTLRGFGGGKEDNSKKEKKTENKAGN